MHLADALEPCSFNTHTHFDLLRFVLTNQPVKPGAYSHLTTDS